MPEREPLLERELQLHIHLQVHITGDDGRELDVEIPIPESYDAMDVRAMTVRAIEDAAFEFNLQEYGRSPSRGAIIAMAARLKAVKDALDRMPRVQAFLEHRRRLQEILDATNDEITGEWGEDPEG